MQKMVHAFFFRYLQGHLRECVDLIVFIIRTFAIITNKIHSLYSSLVSKAQNVNVRKWPRNMQYLDYYKDYFSKFIFCNKFPIFNDKFQDNYCQIANRLQQAMFPLSV